jgi:hypothetical protein
MPANGSSLSDWKVRIDNSGDSDFDSPVGLASPAGPREDGLRTGGGEAGEGDGPDDGDDGADPEPVPLLLLPALSGTAPLLPRPSVLGDLSDGQRGSPAARLGLEPEPDAPAAGLDPAPTFSGVADFALPAAERTGKLGLIAATAGAVDCLLRAVVASPSTENDTVDMVGAKLGPNAGDELDDVAMEVNDANDTDGVCEIASLTNTVVDADAAAADPESGVADARPDDGEHIVGSNRANSPLRSDTDEESGDSIASRNCGLLIDMFEAGFQGGDDNGEDAVDMAEGDLWKGTNAPGFQCDPAPTDRKELGGDPKGGGETCGESAGGFGP